MQVNFWFCTSREFRALDHIDGQRWELRAALRLLIVLFALLTAPSCSFLLPRENVKYIMYTVQRGDTLYEIAQRFRVGPDELQTINRISDPREMAIGQFMRIPYRGQSLKRGPGDASGVIHNIRRLPSKEIVRTVKLSSASNYVARLSWPVQSGGRLNSVFGRRWLSFHEGIDISGPTGTPVLAAHDGQVVYSDDELRGYGNLIVLKGQGLVTVYGHNDANLVRRGEMVRRGQQIAELGSSGQSSGPHLHFETRIRDENNRNVAVDPLAFFP